MRRASIKLLLDIDLFFSSIRDHSNILNLPAAGFIKLTRLSELVL